ncbi:type III-B CRISPR module RAMP protein Cmr4 [Anaerobranca gottschalkii]|uniref:CRISPR-associated protein Cmr4 n=1 Tax=Anaerobranca gottschalkii DSM 13577 TaxID=1120990 RepID=A0A1I0C1I2_9FIRM|nr:type III-B CRISPR module RAMP protein Cmr4 [Anaerobranca gottschalkii]SET12941.1 CRISPR-associated protein Cmr4 [Anaerobranca gottschalkii DSM 13577]
MYKIAFPLFFHVQTPLHVGAGGDVGLVDLPIQREKHTAFPKIESSGVKGCLREAFEGLIDKEIKGFGKVTGDDIELLFGPEETGDKGHAASLGFSDARLLFFPVRSVKGVFAWVTCPGVLKRFKRDLEICDIFNQLSDNGSFVKIFFGNLKYVPPVNSVSSLDKIKVDDGQIVLEEYALKVEEKKETKSLGEELSDVLGVEDIKDKLVILHDDVFKDFVQLFTEVITRTKIDSQTGTVKPGALFTEEYLPAESVLYSLSLISPIFAEKNKKGKFISDDQSTEHQKIADFFIRGLPDYLQIGANTTLGKGIVKVVAFTNDSK